MALRIRRDNLEPRLEVMPLLDVVFLLLTFFIYAMVMMIRAQLLPVQLPSISHGRAAATGVDAISITVDQQGLLFVDALPVAIDEVIPAVREIRRTKPNARVYLATAAQGDTDRLPIFIELINQLRGSGLDEFFIVGRPEDDARRPRQ